MENLWINLHPSKKNPLSPHSGGKADCADISKNHCALALTAGLLILEFSQI
jgi:hypothetical protein